MPAFVAYLRVSTQKQGQSGLGIEAQQASVANFVREGDAVLATYTEVESGRNCARPQQQAALAECRKRKAILLIAKLDRLSRNVAFLATLLEGDVQIVACDNPHAERFTLHILAAVAEHEARMISQRTKSALAAARNRGVVLGGFRGREPTKAEQAKGHAVQAAAARARALELLPSIDRVRAAGATTPSAIADALNSQGITTHSGARWQAIQVTRLLARVAA
jgi:DNA invertase Pin-like site-specific DNA recombinase